MRTSNFSLHQYLFSQRENEFQEEKLLADEFPGSAEELNTIHSLAVGILKELTRLSMKKQSQVGVSAITIQSLITSVLE
jgi:hypothetical protein